MQKGKSRNKDWDHTWEIIELGTSHALTDCTNLCTVPLDKENSLIEMCLQREEQKSGVSLYNIFEDAAGLSTVTNFMKKVGKNLVLVTSVKGKNIQLLWKEHPIFFSQW